MAEVDPRRVERILRNLLANAIDHGEGKPVLLRLRADDDAAAFIVRDQGVGLRPGEEKLVFNRFWRSDPSRVRRSGGTGLGLAISVEDANLHDGKLEAWGEPGQGACFRLTLPRVRGRKVTRSPLPLEPGTTKLVQGQPPHRRSESRGRHEPMRDAASPAGTAERAARAAGPDERRRCRACGSGRRDRRSAARSGRAHGRRARRRWRRWSARGVRICPDSSTPQAIGTIGARPVDYERRERRRPDANRICCLRDFVKASTDPANRHLAARQYLTKDTSARWDDAASATIVDKID